MPGRNNRSARSSSSSLNAARDRYPSRWVRRTYGSSKCSRSQRPLDLLRLAISIDPGGCPYNPRMPLSVSQKKHLRGLGHSLDPVVLIGQQGLTDAVVAEARAALHAHELIKVRARVGDRKLREEIFAGLAARTGADLVQEIGNVGLFYKKNNEIQKILLPDS